MKGIAPSFSTFAPIDKAIDISKLVAKRESLVFLAERAILESVGSCALGLTKRADKEMAFARFSWRISSFIVAYFNHKMRICKFLYSYLLNSSGSSRVC